MTDLDTLFGKAVQKSQGTQEVSPPKPQPIVIDSSKVKLPEKRELKLADVLARYHEMINIGLSEEDVINQLYIEFNAKAGQIETMVTTPEIAKPSILPTEPTPAPVQAEPPEIIPEPKPTSLDSLFKPKPPVAPLVPTVEEKPVEKPKPVVVELPKSSTNSPERYVEAGTGKIAIMDYGHKGEGKTGLALGIVTITEEGTRPTVIGISLDRQTAPIKNLLYLNDPRIKVFDVIGIMDYGSPAQYLSSSEEAFIYLQGLINDVIKPLNPDWVVIDGSEVLQNICEMVMRSRNNLMPFQGIANLNLWKERQMYLRQIHNSAMEAAKRGVIYTAYVEKDEIIEDGNFKSKKDHPKWIDVIMRETSVVIRTKSEQGRDGRLHFVASVESSKTRLPTGLRADVTGKDAMKEFWRKLDANN